MHPVYPMMRYATHPAGPAIYKGSLALLALLLASMGCGKATTPASDADAAAADARSGASDASPADAASPGGCTTPPCSALVLDVPAVAQRNADILFVIDNSQSMAEEQEALLANFPRFIDVLGRGKQGLPNLHIGVISMDMGAVDGIGGCNSRGGDNGTLQSVPRGACTGPEGAFIRDVINPATGARDRNYTDTLPQTFSCIAALGIAGCGFEQPLESLRRALRDNPANAGFLRPDALLAVIFLSDEDDCSVFDRTMFDPSSAELGPLSSFRCFEYGVECANDPDPRVAGARQECRPRQNSPYMYAVDEYVSFLRSLKAEEHQIMLAGIFGPTSPVDVTIDDQARPLLGPSCTSANGGTAVPAIRLQHFVDQFPLTSSTASICANDYSDALTRIAETVNIPLGARCLRGALSDRNPQAPGVQPTCTVTRNDAGAEMELSICDNLVNPDASSVLPCYLVTPDLEQCTTTPTGLRLDVFYGSQGPVPGSRIRAECLID